MMKRFGMGAAICLAAMAWGNVAHADTYVLTRATTPAAN
jgi:hypothetical protein